MRLGIATLFVLVIYIAVPSAGQRRTLEERIQLRAQPNAPLIEEHTSSDFIYDMPSVLKQADLVIYGTVESATSTLAPDHSNLQTDYLVVPTRTLWPTEAVGGGTRTPGETSRVVVKRWGGETTINGVAVTQRQNDYPAFHVGDRLLLALKLDSRDQKYVVASNVGVFAVEGEHLEPWVRAEAYARFRGMALTQFESDFQKFRTPGK